jgi:hypothetical protein
VKLSALKRGFPERKIFISNQSGIGAIFATTRCRVITCSIEQRQRPSILLPADDTRHCPNNRHRSLPFQAAATPCQLKAGGRSSCRAKNIPLPELASFASTLKGGACRKANRSCQNLTGLSQRDKIISSEGRTKCYPESMYW